MIGSGIFLVTPGILREAGNVWLVLLVWILSGIITVLGALTYAELSSLFPVDGGQLVFIREAWGKMWAFAYGLSVVFVIQSGVIAAVATAFSVYLLEIPSLLGVEFVPDSLTVKITAVCMILLLTFIQMNGLKTGAFIQNLFTFSKVGALLMVILLGISAFVMKTDILKNNLTADFSLLHFDKETSGWKTSEWSEGLLYFLSACIGALFSMDAWNNVTFLSNRVENPSVNLPKGLISGVLVVTTLYVLTNLAYFSMIPSGVGFDSEYPAPTVAFAESERVATASLSVFFGNASAVVVAFLIVISTFGCNNGIIMSGGIFTKTMADWGWLPKTLSAENKNAIPVHAFIFQAIWSSLLVFSGSYKSLLVYSTFTSLVFYLVTISGLFKLSKQKNIQDPNIYRCPGYPLVPLAYLLLTGSICLALVITDTKNCLMGLFFSLAGMLIYFFFVRKNK